MMLSANSSSNILVLFIGNNGGGQFGVGSTENDSIGKFIKCTNPSISKVFTSTNYTIYSDDNYQNIWSAGNTSNQCCSQNKLKNQKVIKTYLPITYFQDNQIKIKKICVSLGGKCTYFISDDDKLYGCGRNEHYEMGLASKNGKIRSALNKLFKTPQQQNIYTPTLIYLHYQM